MNKKLVSLVTAATITFTSVSPAFAKNFTSKQNVALNHAWTVKFNKTLGSNQDFSKVNIKDDNGNVIPVNIIVNSDKQSVKVVPKKNYSSNTNYILTLDNIKDINGKDLKENATMKFTTINQPTEDIAILPQAVAFNNDGSVTPLTTNDYVNIKAYPGKGYGNYDAILNPDYDKNYGLKHTNPLGVTTPCYIDNNNVLNFAYKVEKAPKTFSEGFQYNKYMKDQLREMMKAFIGTTPYNNKHFIYMAESNEYDNIHDAVTADYYGIQSDGYYGVDFTYFFPIKPLKSIDNIPDGETRYIYFYTYRNIKDNANIVLEIDDYSILDDAEKVEILKQSLYAAFGKNYYDKIYDFITTQRAKRQKWGEAQRNSSATPYNWDGNDTLNIGNMTIYSTYYGRYYSFFLK